jgi:hypothetical protein
VTAIAYELLGPHLGRVQVNREVPSHAVR